MKKKKKDPEVDQLQENQDAGIAAAEDAAQVGNPPHGPEVDPELGELMTDEAPKEKAPADEKDAKHKGRTAEEIKELGGGMIPGQPTRGPEAKNWKPPKPPVSPRMAGKPVRSAEEIRKLGGGLKPGTPTRNPE